MALLLFLACWLLLCARGVAHDSGGVGQAGLASRKGQKAASEGRRCPQVPSEGRYVQALLISHGSIAIGDTQDSAASHMNHLCSPCAHIAEPLHSILHHLQASPVLCCHPRPGLTVHSFPQELLTGYIPSQPKPSMEHTQNKAVPKTPSTHVWLSLHGLVCLTIGEHTLVLNA